MAESGEALNRKYWELKGFILSDWKGEAVWFRKVPGGSESHTKLPALHLDLNLAIAEADRELRPYEFQSRNDGVTLRIWHGEKDGWPTDLWITTTGPTALNEAILRALIAKLEAK